MQHIFLNMTKYIMNVMSKCNDEYLFFVKYAQVHSIEILIECRMEYAVVFCIFCQADYDELYSIYIYIYIYIYAAETTSKIR